MSEDIRQISEFERRLRNAGVNMNGMVFQSLEGIHSAVLGILTDEGNDPGAPQRLQSYLDASEATVKTLSAANLALVNENESLRGQLTSIEAAEEPVVLPPQDPLPVPEATGPSTPTSETSPPSPEPVADPT